MATDIAQFYSTEKNQRLYDNAMAGLASQKICLACKTENLPYPIHLFIIVRISKIIVSGKAYLICNLITFAIIMFLTEVV